jgi:hypothetical protein
MYRLFWASGGAELPAMPTRTEGLTRLIYAVAGLEEEGGIN